MGFRVLVLRDSGLEGEVSPSIGGPAWEQSAASVPRYSRTFRSSCGLCGSGFRALAALRALRLGFILGF